MFLAVKTILRIAKSLPPCPSQCDADGFEDYLNKSREAYYKIKPASPYEFNFFPRWACGPIFQTEIDKAGVLFVPKQTYQNLKLPGVFVFKITKRGLEITANK